MSSEFDPNTRDIRSDAPSDYASVKYAAAVLLVAGALVAAAVAGVFNSDSQTAQTTEQPPATSADATDAAKQPDAMPKSDAATGASTGEAGSQAAPPAAETPPATTPATEAPAAQPEPEQPQPAPQQQ